MKVQELWEEIQAAFDLADDLDLLHEWETRPVKDDPEIWQVRVNNKWVTGHWRTVRGHRVFYRRDGGTLPKKPIFAQKAKKKPGVIRRVLDKISGRNKMNRATTG